MRVLYYSTPLPPRTPPHPCVGGKSNTNKGRNCVMQSLSFLFVKSKIQNTRLHAYTVTRLENGSSSLAEQGCRCVSHLSPWHTGLSMSRTKHLPSIIKNLSYSAKISASFCSISSPLKSRARIVPSGEKSII